ncbi:MAG: FAD-binding dehydrogenase [Candidatus Hydrogenedens sp.]|nr:FAD-binding dehydrogenase [Candidatus Hydrogenedens sp.]
MPDATYSADVIIAGGGLAGLTAAYELLDLGKRVVVFDKAEQERLGGLAKESFGGVLMVDTPYQRRMGIKDSPQTALEDWCSYAEFGENDEWPRKWAEFYCHNSDEYLFDFFDKKDISFLPVVNWPERGADVKGNSLPRWHITWGTGYEIIAKLQAALEKHPRRANLQFHFGHEVSGLVVTNGAVTGIHGKRMADGTAFEASAEHTIIASGGMCGGDLSTLRKNWYKPWGEPPKKLLNGAHDFGDGKLLEQVREAGGNVTHLDKQWHYAAGIHHPAKRRPDDGISLVPPRSALWVNALGERILNPRPIVAYTDTRHLVESVLKQPGQYSWQVMNWKIAIKELAVSGCSYMTAFRNKSKPLLLKSLLFGNPELVKKLAADCPDDIVMADSIGELVGKMNERNLYGLSTSEATLRSEIEHYDSQIERGEKYFNDEQLRCIMNFRTYRGDKLRLCKYQAIDDPGARPLMAIREFILARKSLGGIQTDLASRVLREDGAIIPGLYAAGEAAGFGGGGISGLRSLEGTFLGGCVLTGRVAGRTIAGA